MYMCHPRLIDSGLKTVYIQVKNIWVINMYMVLGGSQTSRSLKVSKLDAENVDDSSWFHKRMALGKKELRCALTDDFGTMNLMLWPLEDLPGIKNGVVLGWL